MYYNSIRKRISLRLKLSFLQMTMRKAKQQSKNRKEIPAVMLKDFAEQSTVYVVTGYSDLRKGIDGLAAIVQGVLKQDPFSKSLFLFCGRRRDRIKGLLWEGDGFLLLYKRLDNGAFRWPRNETEARLLTEQEVRWLMEGLELEQPKAIRQSKPGTLY